MTKQKVKMALGKIVVDPNYQVRKRVLSDKVSEYSRAMERGDDFPPMVIETGSNKIVSGFTRLAAYERQFDTQHSVSVFVAEFDDDNERYVFALEENMKNGAPLISWDRENAVFEMRRRGFEDGVIAKVINWTVHRVVDVAGVKVVTFGARSKKVRVPAKEGEIILCGDQALKGGLDHLKGTTVNQDVYHNIEKHYVGWTTTFMIKQLLMRINDGTLNPKDVGEVSAFVELREKLTAMEFSA